MDSRVAHHNVGDAYRFLVEVAGIDVAFFMDDLASFSVKRQFSRMQ